MLAKRWSILIAVMALAATVMTGVSAASSANQKYTGCLQSTGKLVKVAVGSDPAEPCTGAQTEITWNKRGRRGAEGPAGRPGVGYIGGDGLAGGQVSYAGGTLQQIHTVMERTFEAPSDGFTMVSYSVNHLPNNLTTGDTFWVGAAATVNQACGASIQFESYNERSWHSMSGDVVFPVDAGTNTVRICVDNRSSSDPSWILEVDNPYMAVVFAAAELVLSE